MIFKKRILPLLLTLLLVLPWCGFSEPEQASAAELKPMLQGVDVSSYNGQVDWQLLAGNGISFVILRGGKLPSENDEYFEDTQFDLNYEEARKVGLKVGVYMRCGATSQEKFEEAVRLYIETIQGKTFDFPVFLDVEEEAQQKLGKDAMTQFALDGLAMIEEAGFKAGCYANLNWFTNYLDRDKIRDAGYPLWLARYTHDCTSNDFSDPYSMWQYSDKGQLPGNGKGATAIDLDVTYVDFDYHPELRLVKDDCLDGYLPLHVFPAADEEQTACYADCKTPIPGSTITQTTECTISEVYTNGWCRFFFNGDGGRRVGYLPLNKVLGDTLPEAIDEITAPGIVPTYTRSSLTLRAGSLARRDACRVTKETERIVQLVYPVSDGYKIAWVNKDEWEQAYLLLLQDALHKRVTLTQNEVKWVDCNGDGIADVFDLGLMKRNLLVGAVANPDSREAAVAKHLANMTLQEKVYQLFIVTPESLTGASSAVTATDAAAQTALQERPVGGIVYFAQNLKSGDQTKSMIANAQTYAKDAHGTGLFIAVDEEGGRVARVAKTLGTTAYDPMSVYGAKGDAGAVEAIGEDIAADISQFGFNVDFAPVADVNINPNNELGDRIFSSDPAVVADMSAAMVRGLQKSGKVSATLKHFPGLGAEDGNTHNDEVCLITRSLDELRSDEFRAFKGGIDAGSDFVMVGHQTMECIGDNLPADLSYTVMTKWLRNELGYNGIIVTDSHTMATITKKYTPGEAAKASFAAGADMILMPADVDAAFMEIYKAVRSGEIPESRLNESVRRILRVKAEQGLLA
ncbi:MAG: hypothetical protein IKN55_13240 [Oscillospiraceae bacterium]|nr:hypothetical protein [Oscillospiraceae bacterium]